MNHDNGAMELFRDQLKNKGYYSDENIIVEENTSENGRINALLQRIPQEVCAKRYPDFILYSPEYPRLLIVMEGRSGEGAAEKSPSEDRTLVYSAVLTHYYDVLTIAVRETAGGAYRIDHFLQRCGEYFYRKVFGGEVLSMKEYSEGIKNLPTMKKHECAQLILDIPCACQSARGRAAIATKLFLVPPRFRHIFMDNRDIRMMRR